MSKIRVLGVDPGLANCGYFVIDFDLETQKITPVKYGMITTPASYSDARRLRYIYDTTTSLIDSLEPDYMGTEKFFANMSPGKDPKVANQMNANTQKLNQVVGVLLAAGSECDVEQYSPMTIKKDVTGNGRAEKKEVQAHTAKFMSLPKITPTHTADAGAIAITRLIKTEEYIRHGQILGLPLFGT